MCEIYEKITPASIICVAMEVIIVGLEGGDAL